jgi:hypothetical protein
VDASTACALRQFQATSLGRLSTGNRGERDGHMSDASRVDVRAHHLREQLENLMSTSALDEAANKMLVSSAPKEQTFTCVINSRVRATSSDWHWLAGTDREPVMHLGGRDVGGGGGGAPS